MTIENKDAGGGSKEKNLDPKPNTDAGGSDAGKGGDSKKTDEGTDDEGGDEEIKVKKSDWDKVNKERNDFETAVKIANQKKGKKETRTVDTNNDSSEFVRKEDVYKTNEKTAIKRATTISKDDPDEVKAIKKDLDEHWEEIKNFYTGQSGKESPEDIEEDLFDAHAVWLRRNKGKTNDGEDKKAKADLSQDRGTRGGGKDSSYQNRKRILPKFTKPTEWYKAPEKKG